MQLATREIIWFLWDPDSWAMKTCQARFQSLRSWNGGTAVGAVHYTFKVRKWTNRYAANASYRVTTKQGPCRTTVVQTQALNRLVFWCGTNLNYPQLKFKYPHDRCFAIQSRLLLQCSSFLLRIIRINRCVQHISNNQRICTSVVNRNVSSSNSILFLFRISSCRKNWSCLEGVECKRMGPIWTIHEANWGNGCICSCWSICFCWSLPEHKSQSVKSIDFPNYSN